MAVEQQSNEFVGRTENGITVYRNNTSAVLGGATNSLRSSTIKTDYNGKSLRIAVDILVAFSVVSNTPVTLDASMDNTNWITVETLSSDVTPSTIGTRFYTVDLTNAKSWPYLSIHFNGSSVISSKSVGTSGKVMFSHYTI